MNLVNRTLMKLGILRDDIDYHFVRASMVLIFAFFGYQKWFSYEAQALIPFVKARASDIVDVPRVRRSGRHMVPGSCRVDLWAVVVAGILE